jgi:hypothetical protein
MAALREDDNKAHAMIDSIKSQPARLIAMCFPVAISNREGLFLLTKSYITKERGQVTGEGRGGGGGQPCSNRIRAPAAACSRRRLLPPPFAPGCG